MEANGFYKIELTYGKNSVGTLKWRVGSDHPKLGRGYSSVVTLTRTR